jgi:hypothetical protein
VQEAPPGNGADDLHPNAVRLDCEAALDECAALRLGKDEASGHPCAIAEDRNLATVLEPIDNQVVRRRAERPLDDAAVATALLQVSALDLEHLRPPLGVPVGISNELPDPLRGRVDEYLLGRGPLHA